MKKDTINSQKDNATTATPEELTNEELELVAGGFEVKSSDLVTERDAADVIVCVSGC